MDYDPEEDVYTCHNGKKLKVKAVRQMAHNMNKLHHKIQGERTCTHLYELKKSS